MAIDLNVLVTAALALYRIDENLREEMRSLEPNEMDSLTETLVALGKIDAPEPQPNPIISEYVSDAEHLGAMETRQLLGEYLKDLSDGDNAEILVIRDATQSERRTAILELNEVARGLLGLV